MTEVSASLVKELRELSGAGMMDCKKALNATAGNIESAIDWLRKKGLSSAAGKAGRIAADGLVGLAIEGTQAALVEVNAETDFVARNQEFQQFVENVSKLALKANDTENLKKTSYLTTNTSVEEQLVHLIAKIGENLSLRRLAKLSVKQGVIAGYIHNAQTPNLGKIGVLVALESEVNSDELKTLGKQLAMHIAATSPLALSIKDLDFKLIEHEKSIFAEQAKISGKPDNIVEKMVEGRLRKYYEEVVLLEQTFVIDGESKIKSVIENLSKKAGKPVHLTGFVRMALGEGIQKEEKDFANEVAAQLK
ncbi:MAG: translation elongation factor Ts [Alphaproteobacteria bacterium]|nr:translation elongation factor Ts [Alphaproteobacteria bacterium]